MSAIKHGEKNVSKSPIPPDDNVKHQPGGDWAKKNQGEERAGPGVDRGAAKKAGEQGDSLKTPETKKRYLQRETP